LTVQAAAHRANRCRHPTGAVSHAASRAQRLNSDTANLTGIADTEENGFCFHDRLPTVLNPAVSSMTSECDMIADRAGIDNGLLTFKGRGWAHCRAELVPAT
jgi:hypothetical protein